MEALRIRLEEEHNLSDGIRITIDDDKNLQVSEKNIDEVFAIDINEFGESEIQKLIDRMPDLVTKLVEHFSQIYLREIKKHSRSSLKEHKKDQGSFENILRLKWGKAIDLFELLILLSQEIGGEYNNYIRESGEGELSPRFEVLSRSHARSCQVALEILTLLKNGFADSAHARWRTLHEIAVEANIIRDGNDDLAIRFLNYSFIQEYKSAQTYQKFCSRIQFTPLSIDEMNNLEKIYNELIGKYGKDYSNEHGWASHLIMGGRPKFNDLENLANFEHMRPFYKLACLNVHSGPRGVLFRLGLNDEQQENILLAGPSANGLGDPIQNAAYSLLQTTSSLLTYDVNMDYLVALNVLFQLEKDIFQAVDQIIGSEIRSQNL